MTVAGSTFDSQTTALYGQLEADLNAKRRRGLSDKAVLDALVDEMAYTRFNRLTALRFMEVRGYTLHALSSSTPGFVDPTCCLSCSLRAKLTPRYSCPTTCSRAAPSSAGSLATSR